MANIPENQATPTGYVIEWQNQSRSGKGRGRTVMSRDEAEALAKELNESHPHIKHWVVPAR